MRAPSRREISLLLSCFFMMGCGSWSQRGAKGLGLLPKASPGDTKYSSQQPKNPYTTLAAGIMTRTLFESSSGRGYRVEVRDLLVGPGQRAENVSLPGAAVFEIRSGNGVLTVAASARELKLGSTFALAEGQSFTVENKSDSALAMRVYLFRAE